jgi:polyhydroxyalkanoate synthase
LENQSSWGWPGALSQSAIASQQRWWKNLSSLPRVLEIAESTRVGTTPSDVVMERGALRLLRYRRETPASYAEPVLFCYALVNRPYILDLQEGKSVVQRYLERGFDVYLIDWGVPTESDRDTSILDYVEELLKSVVDFVLAEHRLERLHLVGYCMGGTLATLFTALHQRQISTLTLLAAPIDFSDRTSLLNVWTDARHFDVDALLDAHGNCPAWFLQSCFQSMKPVQNYWEKHVGFFEQLSDVRFLSAFFAMERWVNDNIPVAGETFREFVKKLYQGNQLVRGEFYLGERRVDLRSVTCPLLLLTAKNDHLVAPASTEGIRPHVGSSDIDATTIDAGHVGLVVSGKAQKSLWPSATNWLAERSTERRNPHPGVTGR